MVAALLNPNILEKKEGGPAENMVMFFPCGRLKITDPPMNLII
tara:strand:+ start:407 stop:535 length:129 start_codon:yes stop_codon:yes gene_type:complete